MGKQGSNYVYAKPVFCSHKSTFI